MPILVALLIFLEEAEYKEIEIWRDSFESFDFILVKLVTLNKLPNFFKIQFAYL